MKFQQFIYQNKATKLFFARFTAYYFRFVKTTLLLIRISYCEIESRDLRSWPACLYKEANLNQFNTCYDWRNKVFKYLYKLTLKTLKDSDRLTSCGSLLKKIVGSISVRGSEIFGVWISLSRKQDKVAKNLRVCGYYPRGRFTSEEGWKQRIKPK